MEALEFIAVILIGLWVQHEAWKSGVEQGISQSKMPKKCIQCGKEYDLWIFNKNVHICKNCIPTKER